MKNFLRVSKKLAIIGLLVSSSIAFEGERDILKKSQLLENYSFDFSAHKLPVAFDTYGAAVQLHSKYKLIPDVDRRNGAIVLNKKILADRKYELDVEFKFQSDEDYSHGFAIYLLGDEPSFPREFDSHLGYRPDYKGLGVFLYRSERRKKWYIISIQNKGLKSILEGKGGQNDRNLDDWINAKNSCDFDLQKDQRGGIRIKILYDYIYIDKKEANGEVSYSKCIVNQIRDPNFHHLALVANNQIHDDRISNIDIEALFFKNLDPKTPYTDDKWIAREKMELVAKKNRIEKLEDGTYHPQDLMAHNIRTQLEQENRKALTFLDRSDDKFEMLFKHYETIQSYQHAFEELIKRAQDYRKQEQQEAHFTLKASELGKIQSHLDEIKERAAAFNSQFDAVKKSVSDTFNAQLMELMTSVDTTPQFGIDRNLGPTMEELETKVDILINRIDNMNRETEKFKQKYQDQLEQKSKFYEDQRYHENKNKEEIGKEDASKGALTLDQKAIEDIKFGAETVLISLKEKYLGRLPGAKRGESELSYTSNMLTIGMSTTMFLILLYLQKLVNAHAKNKMW